MGIIVAGTVDVDPSRRLYVFEEWEREADLAAHLKAAPYLDARDTIGRFGIRTAATKEYRIERSEPSTTTKACRARTSREPVSHNGLHDVGAADNNAAN